MNDLTERELHTAFDAKVGFVSPEVTGRLTAFDYRPRKRSVSVVAKLGAVASTGTAAIVAAVIAIISLSSDTTAAFAGWTAVPAQVAGPALARALRACGDATDTRVLAAESRGPFVAIVFVRANAPWQCISRGPQVLLKQTTRYPARLYSTPPAGKITEPSQTNHAYEPSARRRIAELNAADERLFHDRMTHHAHSQQDIRKSSKLDNEIGAIETGPQALITLTGTAGRTVTAVRFVLADGKTVSATVQDGWYEAWWPGSSKRGGAQPVRVEVTTPSGTRSSPIAYGPFQRVGPKLCMVGARCSVYAPTILKQQIAPALEKYYAFFRNTRPARPSSEPKFLRIQARHRSPLRDQFESALGIDNAQARLVKLGDGNYLWVVPGSEGLCVELVSAKSGGGGCDDIKGTLRWGAANVSYNSTAGYLLHGLVPNGNKTIAVHLRSGTTITVPVHDNVVYRVFSTPVKSFTFKNAFGNEKNYPA